MKLIETLKARWVVWVWNHTPNCAEMSRLASRSFEQPTSRQVRFRMRLHYLICVWCERYAKQLKFLHRLAPRFPEQLETVSRPPLSPETKQAMVHRLRHAATE